MKASEFFPTSWLKAEDIMGKEIPVTIKDVQPQRVGDDQKLILSFFELKKSLVLNKTNYERLSESFGDETDNWINKRVTLYVIQTNFRNKEVAAIRLRVTQ